MSRACSITHPARIYLLNYIWLLLLLYPGAAVGQNGFAERTYHASKIEVEQSLRELKAYSGGKLPILDGFVLSAEHSLDQYQRGYYQYSLQVIPIGPNETRVRAIARITVWYIGDKPAAPGYQVLQSNGRLESDLFDRLDEALKPQSAAPSDRHQPASTEGEAYKKKFPVSSSAMTSSPSAAGSASPLPNGSVFTRAITPSLPRREPTTSIADEKLIQQLREHAKSLQEILDNQARPDNLAVVKAPRTSVLSRPEPGAQVILLADAEDEFQILDTLGPWVHVQISGISRGWVLSSELDLPGSTASNAASVSDFENSTPPLFRQTREETSTFPGNWEPLRGKKVKMIWVQPSAASDSSAQSGRLTYAKSMFKKAFPELSQAASDLAGVVIVFDSQDGGMAAATLSSLQQWQAGHLTDQAFWKHCWLDPADAFKQ
ncbi:MAG TPA: hypothetical protein VFA76_02210 [Terriglobales bacterium]|nr:hypothetical protein [Terriglobales bacterium]